MRYWFLDLQITCGEYEFNSTSVHETDKKEFDAETYAKEFYDNNDDDTEDNEIYYFNGGEVAVEVCRIDEITKKEYDILKEYI